MKNMAAAAETINKITEEEKERKRRAEGEAMWEECMGFIALLESGKEIDPETFARGLMISRQVEAGIARGMKRLERRIRAELSGETEQAG